MIVNISESKMDAITRGLTRVRALEKCTMILILVLLGIGVSWAQETVDLAWDPNPESDIAGYVLYYGDASRHYTNSIPVGTATNATVHGLIAGATYYFAVTAKNTAGLESDPSNEVTFTPSDVADNQPPNALSGNWDVPEDTATSITLAGSDLEGDTLTFNILSQPQQGQLTGAAPNLIYTPVPNYSGIDSFSYTVSDQAGLSATATVTLNVLPVNDPPTALSANWEVTEDTATQISLTGSDPDGDTLTFSILSQPQHGKLTGTAPNLVYTPDANYSGADAFTFTAADPSALSAIGSISIAVRAVNDPPTALSANWEVTEDTATQISLTGSDPDDDTLTFSILSQPQHGKLTGTAPNLIYTPNANYSGADAFTFSAADPSALSAIGSISIAVRAVNDPPTALSANWEVTVDTATPISLTGSDPDGDTLTFSILSQPQHGKLTGTAPNLIYTPDANYSGADAFTFAAADPSALSATGSISIAVRAVNDPPTALSANWEVTEDTATQISLTGSDPDGDTLTFSILSQPQHGKLTGTAPNLVYTPDANYSGADAFTFTAADPAALSATGSVTIAVLAVNDPPEPQNDAFVRNANASKTIYFSELLANDKDPDADVLTVNSVSSTSALGVRLVVSKDAIKYSPPRGLNAEDSFTYLVTDGNGTLATATVTITIKTATKTSDSEIRATLAQDPNGKPIVRLKGLARETYVVEASTDLNTWAAVSAVQADDDGECAFDDPDAAKFTHRFYRIVDSHENVKE